MYIFRYQRQLVTHDCGQETSGNLGKVDFPFMFTIFYGFFSYPHYSLLRFSYTSWTPLSRMSVARLVLLPSVAHPGQSSSALAGNLHVQVGVEHAMRHLFRICISLLVFLNQNNYLISFFRLQYFMDFFQTPQFITLFSATLVGHYLAL